jgi:hypothetical protein
MGMVSILVCRRVAAMQGSKHVVERTLLSEAQP